MTNLPSDPRPDHPMADPARAREILAGLQAREPLSALGELLRWHESVAAAPALGADRRIDLLFELDAAAQPRLTELARPAGGVSPRDAGAIHGYWRRAASALGQALEAFERDAPGTRAARNRLPALLVRTLRCLAEQLKWTYLLCAPVDPAVWARFNGAYAFAESQRLADVSALADPAGLVESTPRREFLSGAMLDAISPASLPPRQIELAAQLIAEHAARFVLAPSPAPGMNYCIELAGATGPQRLVEPPTLTPSMRFFGAGDALHELAALAKRVDGGTPVPGNAGLGPLADSETVLAVLRHLALQWAPQPPQRRHLRHAVRSPVSVVHGLAGVLRALGPAASGPPGDAEIELWTVENASAGGFGVVVPQSAARDWLRVGALLALRPEGGSSWIVATVRRLSRTAAGELRLGIETLSRAPVLVRVRRAGEEEQGVLLRGGPVYGAELQLVLPPAALASGEPLEAELAGKRRRYLPQGLDRRGEDYEIGNFRELPPEA